MVERLLSIKVDQLDNIAPFDNQLAKNPSFNTDDDDSVAHGDSQQLSDSESKATKSDIERQSADPLKRSIFSVHSPSIDSINDADALTLDVPISERAKKRKQRRITELLANSELNKVEVKTRPWYTQIDLTKPIMYVAIAFLLYLMWVKRDVWIPRLLTSNSRIRHIAIANEEKLQERGHPSQTTSSDNSTSTNSNQDAHANDQDNNDSNNNLNNDHASSHDENSPATSNKYNSPQKLNVRVRRNKMSFSNKERGRKKRRHVQHAGADDVDADDDVDDIIDDSGSIESDHDEDMIKAKEVVLPSAIRSSKKHRHLQRQERRKVGTSHKKTRKNAVGSKTSLILASQDGIVKQLQKLIKSRGQREDVLTVLSEQTDLKKSKIKQIIQKKDFRQISLDVFISTLNSYDPTLLTVSK